MYDITFFTPERLEEFWDIVGGLLKFASPGVLIAVAIIGVGMLLTIVITTWKKASNTDDDNNDFDIHYYD